MCLEVFEIFFACKGEPGTFEHISCCEFFIVLRVQTQTCLTYTTPNTDPNKPGDGSRPVGPGSPLPQNKSSFKEGLGNPLELNHIPWKVTIRKGKKHLPSIHFQGLSWNLEGILVGGFNPSEKICSSNWIMSPGRDETLKIFELPTPRYRFHFREDCFKTSGIVHPLASAMVRPRLPMTRAICAFGTSTISWWMGNKRLRDFYVTYFKCI